jgi:hypothetical protein
MGPVGMRILSLNGSEDKAMRTASLMERFEVK